MDIQFIGSMIRKCRFENEMPPNQKLQIQVVSNRELMFPAMAKEGMTFPIVTRVSVGNPVQKFSLFFEQVNTFRVVNLEPGFDASRENMRKFIDLICFPTVQKETQATMDQLRELYKMPVKIVLPENNENKGN